MKQNFQLSTFNLQFSKGFTLIEMLVVLFIFAIVGILSTQALALSLRGSKKSENLGVVRENVDYAMNVMERQLHGAGEVTCSPNDVTYLDPSDGLEKIFRCNNSWIEWEVDSNTDRLTSSDVEITCGAVFTCPAPADDVPPSVEINITAEPTGTSGAEGAVYTSFTRVMLRSY